MLAVVPLSAEDSAPTCFLPFPEIILDFDFETVEVQFRRNYKSGQHLTDTGL
jgi:hypothetical protein